MGQLFIDGTWTDAAEGGSREIRCPADGRLVAEVSEATAVDTDRAIAAARTAFDDGRWSSVPPAERGALLLRVADLLQRDRDRLARAETLDTGKRIAESEIDMDDITNCFRWFGHISATDDGRLVETGQPDARSKVVHEPVGVCALITPWNYPLLQTAWKVAPAIGAGCTFVLKPSELTPHTAIILMELLTEAGLPAGVGNLVLGAGATAGGPLSVDPRVDMVSFTGGLATGRVLMANAAATVKKVALELGGKNPFVLFADADHETAVDNVLTGIFLHSGQVCSAGARLVVEESAHDRVVDDLVRRAQNIVLGGPDDPGTETGPLISAAHREKVEAYVARGVAEGAVLRCGGERPTDPRLADGFYYPPTILDRCTQDMSVVHDESFGPVLTVETFTDLDDAVRIANDTEYGLAGAVFSADHGVCEEVAGRLRHGTVWINDFGPYVPAAEWGGFGHSGVGRELGRAGLAEYQEAKHIWTNTRPGPTGWFPSSTPGSGS
ncbi:aldehyde dehydrogenase family protein [Actinomycetospora termitidis]|uniref:Aldehyde dehydrogenase family protein n=1 Tax=Actinomycetospora termitidis TaxID=3053470 RepID=A0ABT7MBL7_9PSEU|nr:aldehyde dehydrogenase family protein [Actinomycetospora sp. Odt1-22]MDL5158059.1 aldehyde dehydrogenase family protein [Actinomycetospora sp. Odt1-22]